MKQVPNYPSDPAIPRPHGRNIIEGDSSYNEQFSVWGRTLQHFVRRMYETETVGRAEERALETTRNFMSMAKWLE